MLLRHDVVRGAGEVVLIFLCDDADRDADPFSFCESVPLAPSPLELGC